MSIYHSVFVAGRCDSARHRGFYIRYSFPLTDISYSAVIKHILNLTLSAFIVSLKKMYIILGYKWLQLHIISLYKAVFLSFFFFLQVKEVLHSIVLDN